MEEIKCPHCGKVFQVDSSGYAAIAQQVRDAEFDRQLRDSEARFAAERDSAVKLALSDAERDSTQKMGDLARKMTELEAKLLAAENDKKLALAEMQNSHDREIADQREQIAELRANAEKGKSEHAVKEQEMQKNFDAMLKMKDEEIDRLKDYKARMSTKLLGESLEQHCEVVFEQLRATGFRNATFAKDNDAKSGSKGDYIFRDRDDDGQEYISIMFEMKNESDTSAASNKKRNEDFFKELDRDRREKGCEYAVLVSMLEADSELYNGGIVDVSHRYPKMYVVRPQFFIPIITLLRNAASSSLAYRRELAAVKAQEIDITNFEDKLLDFRDKFSKKYEKAGEYFNKAIDDIDKTIKQLEKTKSDLQQSMASLGKANQEAQDLSVKKLTRGNPTMKARFAELEKKKDPTD